MATTGFAYSVRPAAGLGQGRRALGVGDLLPCQRRSCRNNDRLRKKIFAPAGMACPPGGPGFVPKRCNIDRKTRFEAIPVPKSDHAQWLALVRVQCASIRRSGGVAWPDLGAGRGPKWAICAGPRVSGSRPRAVACCAGLRERGSWAITASRAGRDVRLRPRARDRVPGYRADRNLRARADVQAT
jgi:hypothetical protein